MTHCISDKSIKKDNACMHHGPSFSAQGSGPRGLGGRAKNKEKQLVTGVSNFNFSPPPFPGARTLDPDTGNSRRIYFLDTRGGDTLKVTVVACPFRHRCQRVATDKTYLKMTVFPGR